MGRKFLNELKSRWKTIISFSFTHAQNVVAKHLAHVNQCKIHAMCAAGLKKHKFVIHAKKCWFGPIFLSMVIKCTVNLVWNIRNL